MELIDTLKNSIFKLPGIQNTPNQSYREFLKISYSKYYDYVTKIANFSFDFKGLRVDKK